MGKLNEIWNQPVIYCNWKGKRVIYFGDWQVVWQIELEKPYIDLCTVSIVKMVSIQYAHVVEKKKFQLTSKETKEGAKTSTNDMPVHGRLGKNKWFKREGRAEKRRIVKEQ